MLCRGKPTDLHDAAKKAREMLQNEPFAHIVFAYVGTKYPDKIIVLGDSPIAFKSDEEFGAYLSSVDGDVEMIYAIHKTDVRKEENE